MATIRYLRNDTTGELVPPQPIGQDEHGRPVYRFVEGFTPVDDQGRPAPTVWTKDGHWTIHPGAGEVESRARADAALYVEEFGAPYKGDDSHWGTEAWDQGSHTLGLSEDDAATLWAYYEAVLTAESERLCNAMV